MFRKPIPRIEWTRYLPDGNPYEQSISMLQLDELTAKALTDASFVKVSEAAALVDGAKANPDEKLPNGIGKRRLQEIEAAIAKHCENFTGFEDLKADELLAGAMAVVARRCGPTALFESYCRIPHNGRVVMRLRFGCSNPASAVRKCLADDKHFHPCPKRRVGVQDTFGPVLED